MSELKAYTYDDMIDGDADTNIEYYPKSEADNVIAELKGRLTSAEKGMDYFKNRRNKRHEEEIAKLKQRLEDVQASMYADVVDAGMENRRLKRALWLARAELCRRLDIDRYLRNHRKSWYNENLLTWADACVAMEVKMCKAESKCRAKAEEYK